jgi:hypothetical protein
MAAPKVFISYKNGHQGSEAFIADVEAELTADFELLRDATMPVGKRWTRELYDWLLGCDAAIIVLSKEANNLRGQSPFRRLAELCNDSDPLDCIFTG